MCIPSACWQQISSRMSPIKEEKKKKKKPITRSLLSTRSKSIWITKWNDPNNSFRKEWNIDQNNWEIWKNRLELGRAYFCIYNKTAKVKRLNRRKLKNLLNKAMIIFFARKAYPSYRQLQHLTWATKRLLSVSVSGDYFNV